MFFAILNSSVHQLGIFGFLGGGKNEGRVGGRILWLVLGDGYVRGQLWAKESGTEVLILAKSPESQTTVYEDDREQVLEQRAGCRTYRASGLELIERRSHDYRVPID